jgi:NAD(P)-dependent dehydrogenase (short-subunit alcohol dehydrogenase family)
MKQLDGKVAFVTGGSSGIGLGLVRVLAEEGMKVAFTWRRQDHLDEAMSHLAGRAVHPIQLDVTDRPGFARAADEIERALGPVQLLVNNAGVGVLGLVEHATYDDWDWVMSVNVGGVINAIVTFLPRMLASGLDGHIVNVASMGGVTAMGSAGVYSTSKFALLGLTESLRTDMIGRNIGVSVYCPGPVQSNIAEGERSRPERFADSGYRAPEAAAAGAPPPEFMATAMTAVDAARYVVRGIRNNDLFILSHPEFRDVIASRNAALLAALPAEPVDEARARAIRWLLSNKIYSEGA